MPKRKVTKEKGSTKKGLSTPAYRTGVNAWQAGALPHPLHIPESPALFVHGPPHLEQKRELKSLRKYSKTE